MTEYSVNSLAAQPDWLNVLYMLMMKYYVALTLSLTVMWKLAIAT